MTICITADDGRIMEEIEVTAIDRDVQKFAKDIKIAVEDKLGRLDYVECEDCWTWCPVKNAVEKDLNYYCPECREKKGL